MSTPPDVDAYIASLRTPAQRRYAEWVWEGLTGEQETPTPPKGVNQGMQRAIRFRLGQLAKTTPARP